MATVEERLALLEARLGVGVEPRALTPPITVGELTNVPAPGSQIAAQWAQDVSSRVVQRFPTTAGLKAYAAPVGSYAVAVDTGVVWQRIAAGWSQVTPWALGVAGAASLQGPTTGVVTLATINIPADPSPNRVAVVSYFVRVMKFGPTGDLYVQANVNGVLHLETFDQHHQDIGVTAGDLLPVNCAASGVVQLPANTVVPVTLLLHRQAPSTVAVNAGAHQNRLDVLVMPKG